MSIDCYQASSDNKTYIIGLYPDQTFVYGNTTAQVASIGTYKQNGNTITLNSYIQDTIPVLVKEELRPNLDSAQIHISIISGFANIVSWITFAPSHLEIEGQKHMGKLPTSYASFDSIYTVSFAKKEDQKIHLNFSGRTLRNNFEFVSKNPKSNYFEYYAIDFYLQKFQVLNALKIPLQDQQFSVKAKLLDSDIKDDKLLLNFKKVPLKEYAEQHPALPSMKGITLSGYKKITAAGRKQLLLK